MKTVAIDTETFLICSGLKAPQLVCVTTYDGVDELIFHHGEDGLEAHLAETFRTCRTVWMNAPYDLAVLINKFPALTGPIFDAMDNGRICDVMIREMLIDIGEGRFRFGEDEDGNVRVKSYSLAAISGRRKLGSKKYDHWRLRYHELWDVPLEQWPDEAMFYAMTDAVLTYKVWEHQEGGPNLHDEPAQVAAHLALHLASCYGIRTDPDALRDLEVRTRTNIVAIQAGLVDAGLVRPDGTRDTKAAIRRMIDKVGGDVTLTKAGLEMLHEIGDGTKALKKAYSEGRFVSVSADSCDMSGDSTLKDYATYTQLRNLLTGSIKHLHRGTVLPIQTRFNPLMETGRTSSSGPNIQNLRRAPGVRECFVPREGCVFVAADYSSAELHTLAQTCIELQRRGEISSPSRLAEALNQGRDVHLWFAAAMLGLDYDRAEALKGANDAPMLDARQLAKAANFGFPGGCSARRFVGIAAGYRDSEGNSIDLEANEAQKLRGMWFSAWPEMREYFDYVGRCEDEDGWYWVRQPMTDRIRRRTTYTAACNSSFQGLCADGAKRALYEVTRRQFCVPASALYGTAVVNFVHDEIIVESPEARCDAVARELEAVMEDRFNALVPDCPTRAEAVVMRYWSKKAKRIEHDGKLIPWSAAG